MKKIITGLVLTSLLAVPVIGLTQGIDVPIGADSVFQTINRLINYLFWFLIFAAALVIAFSAYTFLTAAGDPDKTKKARDYVLYALIAVIVGFLAKALVALVARMLDVSIPLW